MWVFVRDTIVKTHSADLRILAVMPPDRGAAIARQLAPLKAELLFVSGSAEAAVAIREDEVFQVALLPASLCDTDWWELWGVLALLNQRDLYTHSNVPTFQSTTTWQLRTFGKLGQTPGLPVSEAKRR